MPPFECRFLISAPITTSALLLGFFQEAAPEEPVDSESEESDVGEYITLICNICSCFLKFSGLILCLIFLKSEQILTEKDVFNQTMMNLRKWETRASR